MTRGRLLVTALLVLAVGGALVSFWATLRFGSVGLRGRITQAIANPHNNLIDIRQEVGFDWDHLYVFGPRTGRQELVDRAKVPTVVAWSISLEDRDDACLLAFTLQGKYRAHIIYPRAQGDFVPAVRAAPYTPALASFEIHKGPPPVLVPVFPAGRSGAAQDNTDGGDAETPEP